MPIIEVNSLCGGHNFSVMNSFPTILSTTITESPSSLNRVSRH